MAVFTYTKIAQYVLDQFFGIVRANELRENVRYLAEDVLGDPSSNNEAITIGDGTSSGEDPDVTINKGTGDPKARWQVNDDPSAAWDLQVDNSDSDAFKHRFANSTIVAIETDGNIETQGDPAEISMLVTNQGTGDASITLRVNDTTANQWKLVCDNSSGDDLVFTYNAVERWRSESTGGVSAPYFKPTGDDTSAPGANRLYEANVPKAWAHLDVALSVVVDNDHNISSASYSGTSLTVNIDTNLTNSDYAVLATFNYHAGACITASSLQVDDFVLGISITSLGGLSNWSTGNDVCLAVFGDQ